MEHDPVCAQSDEPVGIVITRGTREQSVPRFWAYFWAPGPESGISPLKGEPRAA
ncbi:MAG: hypothetical protein NVS1B4_14590 [Gemmatimonadaceae bacterium]